MDFISAYRSAQANPEFAKLSYSDQIKLRDQIFRESAATDPNLQGLTPADVQNLYDNAINAGPVFSDPTNARNVEQLTALRDANDPNGTDAYAMMYQTLSASQGSGLIAGVASKVAAGVTDLLGLQASAHGPLNPTWDWINQLPNNPEAHKVWEYMNARDVLGKAGVSGFVKGGADVSSFLGNVGDFTATLGGGVVPMAAKGAIATAPVVGVGTAGKGALSLATAGTSKVGVGTAFDAIRTAPWIEAGFNGAKNIATATLFRNILPGVVEGAAIAGPAGLAIAKANSALTDNPDLDPFASFENFALNYGAGVGFNVVGGFLTREAIPHIVAGLKGIAGRTPGQRQKPTVAGQADIEAEMAATVSGANIPQALKTQLSEYQQAAMSFRTEIDRIGKVSPVTMTDEDRLFLGTALSNDANDVVIRRMPNDEGYRIFHVTPSKNGDDLVTNITTKTAPDVYSAMDQIGRIVAPRVEALQGNAVLNPMIADSTPWVYTWHATNVAASTGVEKTLIKGKPQTGRLPIQDRFYTGMNELSNNTPGVTMIPVRLGFDEDTIEGIMKGRTPVAYKQLSILEPDPKTPNASMLMSNTLDVPVAEYQAGVNLMKARSAGYDSIRVVADDGSTVGFAPLTPNNLKILISSVDEKGLPAPNITKVMQKAAPSNQNYHATVTANVDETMPLAAVGDNTTLMTRFATQRFSGDLNPTDVRTFTSAMTGVTGERIKITVGNKLTVAHNPETGGIELTIPPRLTTPAERLQFAKTLTSNLNVLNKQGLTKHMESTTARVLRQLYKVTNPETHPLFKVVEGGGKEIVGASQLSKMLKGIGVDLMPVRDGVYRATLRGSVVEGSLSDIYKAARNDLIPPKAIADQLKLQGAKVTVKPDEVIVTVPGNPPASYPTLAIAGEQLGVDMNMLPSKYRPQFVEIREDGGAVQVYGDNVGIALDKKSAMQLLNSFAEDSPVTTAEVIKRGKDFATFVERPDRIDVIDLDTKTRLSFATVEEARNFARTEIRDPYNHARGMAAQRGMSLDYDKGQYVLRTGDPAHPTYRSPNVDDINKIMAEYPTDRLDATELLPNGDAIMATLPNDILRRWKSLNRDFDPLGSDRVADYALWEPNLKGKARQNWSTFQATFNTAYGRAVKADKVHPELQTKQNRLTAANDGYMSEWFEHQKLVGRIFGVGRKGDDTVGSKARVMKDDRQRVIGKYLQAETNEELIALQKELPLTPRETQVVANVKSLYKALATKFGIPEDRRILNYMTRIRTELRGDPTLLRQIQSATTSDEIFARLEAQPQFGLNGLRELKPWFENTRKQDFVDAIFEDRAMVATLRYVQAGLRKNWLNIPTQEFVSTYNTLNKAGLVPKEVQLLMGSGDTATQPSVWFANVTNTLKDTHAEAVIADIGRGFQGSIGKIMSRIAEHRLKGVTGVDDASKQLRATLAEDVRRFRDPGFAERGAAVLGNYLKLQYASLLGFKAMLPVRNTVGVYTMFGPTFGMTYLDDAVKWLHNTDKKVVAEHVNRLMRSNDVGPQHPFSEAMSSEGAVGKFVDVALAMYRNSDTYTRVIGYTAALRRFADASERLARGVFGDVRTPQAKQAFVEYSKLSMFQKTSPQLVDRVYNEAIRELPNPATITKDGLQFGSQGLTNAAEMYAKEVTHITLFNYASYNKPLMFSRGVVGKLAGQLGMFPASYRSYIAQVVRNLSPADVAAWATSFVATNLAFFTAFSAMGVKTNDFIPLMPGLTGMGPSMEMVMNLSDATRPGPNQRTAVRDTLNLIGLDMYKEKGFGMDRALLGTPDTLHFTWPTILPGSTQAYYVKKAQDYASRGEYWKSFLSLTSAQVESDSVDLPLHVPGLPSSIQGAAPRAVIENALDQVSGSRAPFRQ